MPAPEASLRFSRQADLLPLERTSVPVTIVGAGAVGSFVAITLGKMGLSRLTVFDDDVVEPGNLPAQFYRLEDLGKPKVLALADLVRTFEGIDIDARASRFEGGRLEGIVVVAVDSMRSRRVVWDAVLASPGVALAIDGRMGGLVSKVLVVRPTEAASVRRYESTLHSDEAAVQEPCSARSIIFTVLGIGSAIARLVRMELVGQQLPREVVQDHALGMQFVS